MYGSLLLSDRWKNVYRVFHNIHNFKFSIP
jgi:hypothetical protein